MADRSITANSANTTAGGNITVANTSAGGNLTIDSATTGGTVDSHTLSTNEIPSHTHDLTRNLSGYNQHSRVAQYPGWFLSNNQKGYWDNTTGNYRENSFLARTQATGGGGGHSHGFTGGSHNHNGSLSGTAHTHNATFTGTAHNHSISVTNLDMAVQYLDVIIASKD